MSLTKEAVNPLDAVDMDQLQGTFSIAKVIKDVESPMWLWVDSTTSGVKTRECDRVLCEGCRIGDLEMVKKAIADGANPQVQFRLALGEITPIFLCASKGYWEIALYLIEQNEDIIYDTMGFDSTTCLHHAAFNDHPEMCDLLINKGCFVDRQDKLGRTALMDAAEIGSVEVIQVLTENKANLDGEDKEGHTAVSYALDFISKDEDRFLEAAQVLIEKGANPDYAGKFSNRTLLHYVAAQGELHFVKKLVEEYNANPLQKDDLGRIPLDLARENKQAEVVTYLQSIMPQTAKLCQCLMM